MNDPSTHYDLIVVGNSKVYGAALLRLRERDFGEVVHADGVSPAWPLACEKFAPWYDEAERLFHVHGQRGEDPSEPNRHARASVRDGESVGRREAERRSGVPVTRAASSHHSPHPATSWPP